MFQKVMLNVLKRAKVGEADEKNDLADLGVVIDTKGRSRQSEGEQDVVYEDDSSADDVSDSNQPEEAKEPQKVESKDEDKGVANRGKDARLEKLKRAHAYTVDDALLEVGLTNALFPDASSSSDSNSSSSDNEDENDNVPSEGEKEEGVSAVWQDADDRNRVPQPTSVALPKWAEIGKKKKTQKRALPTSDGLPAVSSDSDSSCTSESEDDAVLRGSIFKKSTRSLVNKPKPTRFTKALSLPKDSFPLVNLAAKHAFDPSKCIIHYGSDGKATVRRSDSKYGPCITHAVFCRHRPLLALSANRNVVVYRVNLVDHSVAYLKTFKLQFKVIGLAWLSSPAVLDDDKQIRLAVAVEGPSSLFYVGPGENQWTRTRPLWEKDDLHRIVDMMCSKDGAYVILRTAHGIVMVLSTTTFDIVGRITFGEGIAAISAPSDAFVSTICDTGVIHLIDCRRLNVQKRRPQKTWKFTPTDVKITSFVVADDHTLAAVGYRSAMIDLFALDSNDTTPVEHQTRLLKSFKNICYPVSSLYFVEMPDCTESTLRKGNRLLFAVTKHTVLTNESFKIFDCTTLKCYKDTKAQLMANGSNDNRSMLSKFKAHCLAVSPNGSYCVFGGDSSFVPFYRLPHFQQY